MFRNYALGISLLFSAVFAATVIFFLIDVLAADSCIDFGGVYYDFKFSCSFSEGSNGLEAFSITWFGVF